MPLASQFSQVSTRKKLGKMVPVREHRQCLLFYRQKVKDIDNRIQIHTGIVPKEYGEKCTYIKTFFDK